MSTKIKKHAAILKYLANTASPSTCKSFINTANKEMIDVLCECGLNILNGNVHLTANQRKQLNRHKNNLRCVTSKKTPLKEKKNLLQKGGFLKALLAPILGVVGSLLGSL